MLKKAAILYFVMISLALNLFAVPVCAAEDDYDATAVNKIISKTDVFNLKAKSSILLDGASGTVMMENNSHEKLPIASVTKIMSMLLIMEAIDSGKITFEDTVTVSEHAYSMGGSQVWLKPGEQFTVREMMNAVAIGSANDCTVAMAEHIAGSEDAFVAMMNEKARQLGMNDTNFLDCTGLTDEGHYSSAYDISVMSRELLVKHPAVTEFTGEWFRKFREGAAKGEIGLYNTNKLIRFYEGANGLKTGFTNAAGYCLSAAAKRNNLQLIAVVLGEPDTNTRFAEARKLLDYGFANFETTQVNNKGEVVQEIEVKKGLKMKVQGIYPEDVKLLIKKGEKEAVEREINLENSVEAPVQAGQKLGEVVYKIGGKEVGKSDIVAENEVKKASFISLFFRMILEWFGIGRA